MTSSSHGTSIDRAANASRARKDLLEAELLRLSCDEADRSLSGIAAGLMSTVDLLNDIYYAPVTNITRQDLCAAFSSSSASVTEALEFIRNRFPLRFSADGVLRRILAQSDGLGLDVALLLPVDLRDGTIRVAKQVRRPEHGHDAVLEPADASLPSGKITRPVLSHLKQLRAVLQHRNNHLNKLTIVLRPHAFAESAASESPLREFSQVGFLIHERHVIHEKLGNVIWPLLTMSAHLALNVLFERERYYERSVRQCSLGHMVKCGPAGELRKQHDQLAELCGDNAEITIDVIDFDKKIARADTAAMSWYAMKHFRLPSLSELFTGVGSIQRYEVRAMTRAAIRHLTHAYWERQAIPEQQTLLATNRAVLGASWAIANAAVESLHEELAACAEAAERTIPIRGAPHSVSFVAGDKAAPLMCFREFVNGDSPFDWALEAPSGTANAKAVHAIYALNHVKEAVLAMERRSLNLVKQDAYRIHGDSHFDNFLLDASVPEYPVIVSIDPQWPTDWDRTHQGSVAPFEDPNDDRKEILRSLACDRTYDYAKLLLATTLGYGLIYRRGLSCEISDTGYSSACVKVSSQLPKVVPLAKDSGGISVAALYRLEAPMCDEALQYHLWSGDTIVQHYLEYLRTSELEGEAATAAVIRLWLLTIRHGVSIAAKCLPDRLEVSRAMYGCVCGFIGVGLEAVLGAITDASQTDPVELAVRVLQSPMEALRRD